MYNLAVITLPKTTPKHKHIPAHARTRAEAAPKAMPGKVKTKRHAKASGFCNRPPPGHAKNWNTALETALVAAKPGGSQPAGNARQSQPTSTTRPSSAHRMNTTSTRRCRTALLTALIGKHLYYSKARRHSTKQNAQHETQMATQQFPTAVARVLGVGRRQAESY